MPTFKFTEEQINEVDAGYTPVSKYTPNRVVTTNEYGYAVSSNVTAGDLDNFSEIIDRALQLPGDYRQRTGSLFSR